MASPDLALAVVLRIRDLANEGKAVTFTEDFGGNTLTVEVAGVGHSHVGVPDGSPELLVESLHELLVNGRGLNFSN